MNPTRPDARRRACRIVLFAVLALSAAGLFGCGGDGDDNGDRLGPPAFRPSSATAAPDRVRLTGAPIGDGHLRLDVVIGGPTTSSDLYGFDFNLLLSNPSIVQIAGVATGNALSGNAQANAVINGSRIVVGVTKLAPPGNRVTATEATVVTIQLRMLGRGSTTVAFAGTTPSTSPADAAALDSAGAEIPSVQFDTGTATITQP